MLWKKARKNFCWETGMIEELIKKIQNFKTKILFKCKDFEADKAHLYSDIRKAMAIPHPGTELFEPVDKSTLGEKLSDIEREEANDKVNSEKEMMYLLNSTELMPFFFCR